MTDLSISITLDGAPDLPSERLQALYRITGRSTVELRESILARRPAYTARLFGREHLDVVPRLEKTIAYLTDAGIPFTLTESGEDAASPDAAAPIDLATLRDILSAPDPDAS